MAATTVAAAMVSLGGPAGAAPRPGALRLAGSGPSFTSANRPAGPMAGSSRLTIQLWLRPAHPAAAQQYATSVSTPGRPLFHHYLTPAAYTARFGAGRDATGPVESWLRQRGFGHVQADPQGNYVRATGTVAAIDAAFTIRMENYRSSAAVNAGRYRLHANNRPVSLPRPLLRYVLGVTGLDNAAAGLPLARLPGSPRPGRTHTASCSRYYGQHHISGLPQAFSRTSFPTRICGYSAGQLRGAYGVSLRNDGQGQTVALIEEGAARDMFATLRDYARASHFVAPSPHRYTELSLGQDSCGDPFAGEEQLDVEAAYDMAPGATELMVAGDSCDHGDYGMQGLFDADLAVIDGVGGHGHPLASITSNSWDLGTGKPRALDSVMHAYLVRAAAQGVGMYYASGDASGLETQGDPFSILVGGTSTAIGRNHRMLFQTGWSTGLSVIKDGHWRLRLPDGASSGGPSRIWTQPAYQRGVVPERLATLPGHRSLYRSEPDIAADADVFTPMAAGQLHFPKHGPPQYFVLPSGGTSLATPLVAGIVADAQQGQPAPFGFTDPALYRLHGTPALRDVLPSTAATPGPLRGEVCPGGFCGPLSLITFDDQSPHLPGYTGQVTLKGYDNMTGLGTPNGQLFITALRKLED